MQKIDWEAHFELDGFAASQYFDVTTNVSFAAVPAPGAIALLGLAGISTRRRRG